MKKWLTVIVVLLLLILVLVPGAMGIVAQKRITSLIQNWPTNNPFSIKILSYHRGWFNSTMQLDVTVINPAHNPPIHLLVNEEITHGPVIINLSNHFVGIGQAYAHGEFVVPEDQQALFKQYVDQTTLVSNCLFLHLFGSISVKLNVPEITISNPADPQTKVMIDGLSTDATISPRAAHISSQSVMQSLTWQDAATTLSIDNLHGHSNLSKTVQGLWLGDITLDLDNAAFNENNKTLFSVKNAEYNSSSKEKDGLVNANNHFSFESVTLHDAIYGPAEIAVNVQNVNAEPLAQLKRLTKVIQQQDSPALTAQYSQRTERLVLKTISRGMQLTINPISVQTPNGEITGQLNIAMPNLMDDANGKMIKHPHITIGQLISNGQGSLQISVPKVIVLNNLQNTILDNMKSMSQMLGNTGSNDSGLVTAAQQRASAQLQGWVAAGLIVENGTNYQFNAAYQQGKLLVNGKPIFNPAFGAPAANMPMANAVPANAQPGPAIVVPAPAAPANPTAVPAPGEPAVPAPAPQTSAVPAAGSTVVTAPNPPVVGAPAGSNSVPVPAN